jgi:uncharacterized protein (TIGR02452 family)
MGGRHRMIAAETLLILERGWYDHPEAGRIWIADDLARSVAGTRMWTPEESQSALDEITSGVRHGRPAAARIEVTNETTLAAARRLAGGSANGAAACPDDTGGARGAGSGSDGGACVGCLNFASAKNPGGGFRGGAQAQEESLARSSGLYRCLLAAPEFYSFHRSQRDLRYSDRAIFSPSVPVFRDDGGALLARPYRVAFLTAAAPNAGALGAGHELAATLPDVLSQRAAKVLAVMQASGLRQIVLGAWGCGVFRNSPGMVAVAFARHLGPDGTFRAAFDHVTFAVLDRAPGAPTLGAFASALAR